MDKRKKVELFEEIRRGYTAGETIKGLANKTQRAPANGAAGDRKRDPAGEKEGSKGRAETGAGDQLRQSRNLDAEALHVLLCCSRFCSRAGGLPSENPE
jgi:hypothetical protein